jgi:hypothetical protein
MDIILIVHLPSSHIQRNISDMISTVTAGSSHHPSSPAITTQLPKATPSTPHPPLLPETDAPLKAINSTLGRKTKNSPRFPTPAAIYLHSGTPQEKKTFRLMFLPFLKIVKKTHTRWSQVTKEQKMEQTQDDKS